MVWCSGDYSWAQIIARNAPELVADAYPDLGTPFSLPETDAMELSRNRTMILTIVIALLIGAGITLAFLPPDAHVIALRIIVAPMPLVLMLMAARNLMATAGQIRSGRYATGLFWGSVALLQILFAVVLIVGLLGPSL